MLARRQALQLLLAGLLNSTRISAAAAADTLKIGLPVPLSGFIAESALQMVQGFKLYLKEKGGKLGGNDVDLIVEDTQADPQAAITKMRKLVESDKVDVVCGFLLASEAYAVRDYADQHHVPLMLPISSADDLTQRLASPYIMRNIWTSSQVNYPFGEYAFKKLGYKKIVTVGQDYAFGWETIGGFQYAFEQVGGKIVKKIWVPFDTTDYASVVSQIPHDVDAVFALVVGSNIPKLFKAYDEFGLKGTVPIIGANIMTDEDVLRSMGDEALGVLTSHSYAATLDRPENKKFVEAFRKEYNVEPSYYAEAMYTGAMWLDRSFTKGVPKDPLKVMEAMKAVQLPDAPRGPLKLDDHNNTLETILIRQTVRKKDGSGLENQVIDSFPNVSQFWHDDPATYMARPAYSRDYPPIKA